MEVVSIINIVQLDVLSMLVWFIISEQGTMSLLSPAYICPDEVGNEKGPNLFRKTMLRYGNGISPLFDSISMRVTYAIYT